VLIILNLFSFQLVRHCSMPTLVRELDR